MNHLSTIRSALLVAMAFLILGCGSAQQRFTGLASYYSDSLHGGTTASGERYDRGKLTAAHRSLEFGTRVRVTNLSNDRSVVVKINDRGPYVRGRIIDLSFKAAKRLGIINAGVAKVRVEVLD